jgi:hypothetical protein
VRPYCEDALLPYEQVMVECPPVVVDPRTLVTTQKHLVIGRLLALAAGEHAEGPDPYPHVVDYEGRLYVHNGHHRWLLDVLAGCPSMSVRIQEAQR